MQTIFAARPASERLPSPAGVRGWLWVWLPAVIACGVIALESTQTMSAQHTSGFLRPIFERIFGPISDNVWWWAHHLFRKGGHFVGYGLVCLTFVRGWLWSSAWRVEASDTSWRRRSVALGVACTLIVASCDELHQSFTPGRSGQVPDVLLDTCGGLAMCLLVSVFFGWWRRADARPVTNEC